MARKKSIQSMKGVVAKVHKGYSVVVVSSFKKHPKYEKYFLRTKRYKAVDLNHDRKVGDKVTIIPCRPVSKDKKFKILDK
jgi:small subunit ribosomal protein S17